MKKIIVLTLLLATLQITVLVQAAQESKRQHEPMAIIPFNEHVNQIITTLPWMVQTFTFLQEQGLVDQSFRQFLQTRLMRDDIENNDEQDANFGEVVAQAHDLITANMKDIFIQTLETAIRKDQTLDEFDDLIFVYVMQHKDDFMYGMVNLWLYEWSKIKDKDGSMPLHTAAWSKSTEVACMLIHAGADLNVQYKNQSAPLYLAASNNRLEIARLLINLGADVNIQNERDVTPLHAASRYNHLEIVRMLIDVDANLDIKDKSEQSSLSIAVENQNQEIVHMLLRAGSHINTQDNRGWTPLYQAAWAHNLEMIRMLLLAGADVNIKENQGEIPLHRAFNPGAARMLIDAGANINIQDNNGWTPLHRAALDKNPKIAPILINAGVDINKQCNHGWTALHIGAINKNAKFVHILIDASTNLKLQDDLGKTAEQHAYTTEMRALFDQAREKQDDRTMAMFQNQLKKDWR